MTVLAPVPPGSDVQAPAAALEGTATFEGVTTLEVHGDLDLSTVARVRERIEGALAGHPDRLVVDLSRCAFVDASALGMLLEAHRRAVRFGGSLTLRGCSPRVLRLLSLTGLRRVFDLD